MKRVDAVVMTPLMTQYTPRPEGTLRAKKPNMMGRYFRTACDAAADSSMFYQAPMRIEQKGSQAK